jgi:hypothetical protein
VSPPSIRHKSNAVIAEVGTGTNLTGNPTNQELTSRNVCLGKHRVTLGIDASLW